MKENRLNGYLQLFLMLQIISLVIDGAGFFMNFGALRLMISLGGRTTTLAFVHIFLAVLGLSLNSIVIAFFLLRKKGFISVYIISASLKIFTAFLSMTLFSTVFQYSNFLNSTMNILGIALNVVMLAFWSSYFKSSIALKIYLKSSHVKKVKAHKFKVVK